MWRHTHHRRLCISLFLTCLRGTHAISPARGSDLARCVTSRSCKLYNDLCLQGKCKDSNTLTITARGRRYLWFMETTLIVKLIVILVRFKCGTNYINEATRDRLVNEDCGRPGSLVSPYGCVFVNSEGTFVLQNCVWLIRFTIIH